MDREQALIQTPEAFFTASPGGQGFAVRLLENNMDPLCLRENTLLREGPGGEWEAIDEAMVEETYSRLNAVADLIARPRLTNDLRARGFGTAFTSYRKISDLDPAQVSFDIRSKARADRPDFAKTAVPVPVVHKDWDLDIRDLDASRQGGEPLDLTFNRFSARLIAEAFEDMLILGSSLIIDGRAIYGYTSHPNRITGSAAGDFAAPANVFPTILSMVGALKTAGYRGPYGLYVATPQWVEMNSRYTDGSGDTPLAAIREKLPDIEFIKENDRMTAGDLLMIDLNPDTVDWTICVDVMNVEWAVFGLLYAQYKTLGLQVPRVKSNYSGNTGVAHFNGA